MTWARDATKGQRRQEPPAGYVADPRRPDVFDPALKHYDNGFVKGRPTDPAVARELEERRAPLLMSTLAALSRSPLRDQIVLRGGLTLSTWFPDAARRAHDIDLVVRDPKCGPDSTQAALLLTSIREAAYGALWASGHQIEAPIALDRIWTYERAEGRRVSLPWSHGAIRDTVQIDVVFRAPLCEPPTLEAIPHPPEPMSYREMTPQPMLWFASRSESLAWKILWLSTDMWPQAKDLYDAVMLAERFPISHDLLTRVFRGGPERWDWKRDLEYMHEWSFDWDPFRSAYPDLAQGELAAWIDRLIVALRRSLAR